LFKVVSQWAGNISPVVLVIKISFMARRRDARKDSVTDLRCETNKRTSPTSSYSQRRGFANPSSSNADEILLLDTLLTGFNIKNDSQLALWLGIDKSLLYAIRAGKRRLGIMQRLKILDHIKFLEARSIVEAIVPETLAESLVALNQHLVQSRISKLERDVVRAEPNTVLLDEAKVALGLDTDAELAGFLHVEHNTIATIRAGKAGLGPKPRLRILEWIRRDFSLEVLLQTIESSSRLAEAIAEFVNCCRRPTQEPIP
jgi:hypothetical protein